MNETPQMFLPIYTYQLLQGIAQAPRSDQVSFTASGLRKKPVEHSQQVSYLWSSLNRGLSRLSKLLAVASAWEEPLVYTCLCFSDEASDGD